MVFTQKPLPALPAWSELVDSVSDAGARRAAELAERGELFAFAAVGAALRACPVPNPKDALASWLVGGAAPGTARIDAWLSRMSEADLADWAGIALATAQGWLEDLEALEDAPSAAVGQQLLDLRDALDAAALVLARSTAQRETHRLLSTLRLGDQTARAVDLKWAGGDLGWLDELAVDDPDAWWADTAWRS